MRHSFASATLFALLLGCNAAAAAPLAFVHSGGSDRNTRTECPVDRPCRTFAAAMTVVDAGGEIVALDAENFGTVAITKSVSISGNGQAAVLGGSASVTAVDIASAGVDVVLRGLSINGLGTGMTGVSMSAGSSLAIENCVISNFAGNGLVVSTPAKVRVVNSDMRGNSSGAYIRGGASADVVDSRFTGNRGAGLIVNADTAGMTSASVSRSVASGNGGGFDVASVHASGAGRMVVTHSIAAHNSGTGFLSSASAGTAVMTVGYSTAAHNGIGFAQFPGVAGLSNLETLGNNIVRQNTTDAVGMRIDTISPM